MKKIIIGGVIIFVVGLFTPQIVQAQGTTYLSNLGQASVGSMAVGSDSWLALPFIAGNNVDGYVLNSVQLALTDASGNPSSFTVMLYAPSNPAAGLPGSSLGTFSGSFDPVIGGTYTYTAPSSLMLSPSTEYFIVLTAGTTVANGTYEWSLATTSSYNQNDNWVIGAYGGRTFDTSIDGSSWNSTSGSYPQFAINATPIPEPSELALGALGALLLGFRRWKK